MTWMPTFLETRTDVDYTGYDIVREGFKKKNKGIYHGRLLSKKYLTDNHSLVTTH